jgi:hypothetical protein
MDVMSASLRLAMDAWPLNAPSKLARVSLGMEADWPLTAPLFLPAQPCARRDVRFSQTSTDYYKWSFQASLLFLKMVVNSSPTARFKEHRRPNNTINPVCALGEQGRRITAIPGSRGCSSYTSLRRRREFVIILPIHAVISLLLIWQGGSRWTQPDGMC